MVSIGLIVGVVGLIVFVVKFKGIERTEGAIEEAKNIKGVIEAKIENIGLPRKEETSTGTADRSIEDK